MVEDVYIDDVVVCENGWRRVYRNLEICGDWLGWEIS